MSSKGRVFKSDENLREMKRGSLNTQEIRRGGKKSQAIDFSTQSQQ